LAVSWPVKIFLASQRILFADVQARLPCRVCDVIQQAEVFTMTKLLLTGCALLFASSAAMAKTCDFQIEATDQMQYDVSEMKVGVECTKIAVTLKHTGKLPLQSMGHNWVLTETKDLQPVAEAGIAGGVKADHVPEGDDRVIAHTELVGGGESTSVTFPTSALKKGADYTFFCSFPGHSGAMNGKLIFG
jgi:azurin